MKIKKYIYGVAMGLVGFGLSSCENGDQSFPDYDGGTTVYFANQYPVRTIVLGNDEYDNTLDLQHKCAIYATMGGSYNGKNITLDVAVDNTLCDNLYFVDAEDNPAEPVLPMPSNYYTVGNKIKYNGDIWGSVEVQLTDAFFNDPKAIEQTYVVPLVINSQVGAGAILRGTPASEGATPARQDADAWSVLPKDYVLYCIKYMNPWESYYIRRGFDQITENGKTTEVSRRSTLFGGEINAGDGQGGKGDEVCFLSTKTLTSTLFPATFTTANGQEKKCDLLLTFSGTTPDGACTITSATDNITATGSGKFVTKGAKKAWGGKDRDVLYLEYTVKFSEKLEVSTKDTLVVQTRGTNKKVTFSPKYVK